MDEMTPIPEHVYKPNHTGMPATVAMTGGAVASTSAGDNTQVGAVGLVVAFTGLLAILVQAFRAWLDSRSEKRLITEQNSKIQDQASKLKAFEDKITCLEGKREEERKKRHDLANAMQAVVGQLQGDLFEAKIEVATLSTKLGLTDRVHADAINNTSENIRVIADQIHLPLPAEVPHVDPLPYPIIPSLSGDEIPVFTFPKTEPHQ